MRRVAITALGHDRPGIVAGVTEVLYRLDCNLEETSMARLRGEFAIIVIALAPDELSNSQLREELEKTAEALGLTVALRELSEDEGRKKRLEEPPDVIISVYGADKRGIVYKVSKVLAERKVNVTNLDTRTAGGEKAPVYIMVIEASLPRGLSVEEVREALEPLNKDIRVDITVTPIESAEL